MLFNVHGGTVRGNATAQKGFGFQDPADPTQPCPFTIEFGSGCVTPTGFIDSGETDESFGDTEGKDEISFAGASMTLDKDLGDASLLSITAFEWNEYFHFQDTDGTPELDFNFSQGNETYQISQEFRITSADDRRLRYIAGLFGFYEDADIETSVLPVPFVSVINASVQNQRNYVVSPYAQLEYDITDRLTFTLGGRYLYERKEGFSTALTGFIDPAIATTPEPIPFDTVLAANPGVLVPIVVPAGRGPLASVRRLRL